MSLLQSYVRSHPSIFLGGFESCQNVVAIVYAQSHFLAHLPGCGAATHAFCNMWLVARETMVTTLLPGCCRHQPVL